MSDPPGRELVENFARLRLKPRHLGGHATRSTGAVDGISTENAAFELLAGHQLDFL
jgi:hypothetical protein